MIICNLHMIYSPYGCAIDAATEGNAKREMKMCVCVSDEMEMIRSVCVCL